VFDSFTQDFSSYCHGKKWARITAPEEVGITGRAIHGGSEKKGV